MWISTWLGAHPGLSVHDRAEDAAAVVARKHDEKVRAVWFWSAGLAAQVALDGPRRGSGATQGSQRGSYAIGSLLGPQIGDSA